MAHILASSWQNSLQNPNPSLLPSISSSSSFNPSSTFNPTAAPSRLFSAPKLSVKCRQSDYFELQRPKYSPPPVLGISPKVFVGHSIYKGKAALTIDPKAPEFAPLESGAFKVAREGFLFLQFAPASLVRRYDWNRKQVFSLSVAEIGILISLGDQESCEFFHDPNKGRSDEGKITKVLKVEPFPDGSGHFFNLSVQNKLLFIDERICMPVSKAEFAILVSLFKYMLPHLVGWGVYADSIKPYESRAVNSTNSGTGVYYDEWSR